MINEVLWNMVFVFLVIAIILAFIRLAKGPALPDRINALDMIGIIIIGLFATYAMRTNQVSFLDVAVVLALISFLGTVAFAYYIERRAG